MSQKDLTKFWGRLSVFLAIFSAATWATIQGLSPDFGVTSDQRAQVAALFGLVVCVPLFLLCMWLANRFALQFGDGSWYTCIPAYGQEDSFDYSKPEARMYIRISFVVFILFPLAAVTHFYLTFLEATVIEKLTGDPFGKWNFVSPEILFGDYYRYGENRGVTFFPFYEPLVITISYVWMWYFFLKYFGKH